MMQNTEHTPTTRLPLAGEYIRDISPPPPIGLVTYELTSVSIHQRYLTFLQLQ